MKRLVQFLAAFIIVLGLCGVGSFAVVYVLTGGNVVRGIQTAILRLQLAGRQNDLNTPISTDDTLIRFTVTMGDTPTLVANNLKNAGLIADSELFVAYMRVESLDTQIQASTYFLNRAQTIPQIANTIIDSRNSSITFRVSEGSRLEEIAAAVDAERRFGFRGADFLAATQSAASIDAQLATQLGLNANMPLEGFMFPNTYSLPPNISAVELRDTLLQEFVNQLSATAFADATAQGFTMRDIVTLASIIERESFHSDEDATISSVYRNRLNINMLLQADPTVQYGLNSSRGSWWAQITQADYTNVQSPYNTYLVYGLPPGPIASPSLSAILGALYPETTPYYFFRARCDGSLRHVFAVTFEEHLANGC